MLAPDAAFIAAVKTGNVKIAEIYDVLLSSGFHHYFTSHDQDITWGDPDALYQAVPITRNNIGMNINLEIDTVEITLANISGELYSYAQLNVLDAVQITIKRIIWSESGSYASGMEVTMFVGIADVEFNRQELKLKCRSILDSLNITVPKGLYQEPCIHSLFDEGCALTQSDFAKSGTTSDASSDQYTVIDATSGTAYFVAFDAGDEDLPIDIGDALTGDIAGVATCIGISYLTSSTGVIYYSSMSVQFVDDEIITGGGNTVVVNGTPAETTAIYEMGEIKFTDGPNEGQRRMIRIVNAGTFTVLGAFPFPISAGDAYTIYPGCDKTATTCRDVFNNALNFMGFLYIPQIQETIM